MTQVTDVRTRSTVCVRCGHPGRLVIETSTEVLDRCYHCGDERRMPRAAEIVVGRAGQVILVPAGEDGDDGLAAAG